MMRHWIPLNVYDARDILDERDEYDSESIDAADEWLTAAGWE